MIYLENQGNTQNREKDTLDSKIRWLHREVYSHTFHLKWNSYESQVICTWLSHETSWYIKIKFKSVHVIFEKKKLFFFLWSSHKIHNSLKNILTSVLFFEVRLRWTLSRFIYVNNMWANNLCILVYKDQRAWKPVTYILTHWHISSIFQLLWYL